MWIIYRYIFYDSKDIIHILCYTYISVLVHYINSTLHTIYIYNYIQLYIYIHTYRMWKIQCLLSPSCNRWGNPGLECGASHVTPSFHEAQCALGPRRIWEKEFTKGPFTAKPGDKSSKIQHKIQQHFLDLLMFWFEWEIHEPGIFGEDVSDVVWFRRSTSRIKNWWYPMGFFK